MRHLMLLRHAKTEKESPSGSDRDRRLNARGRSDAPALGRYLVEHRLTPHLALVSPAARALETWQLVAKELPRPPRHEIVEELYGADVSDLLRIARAAQTETAPERLIIVGHNPGLHEFAYALLSTARTKASDTKSSKEKAAGEKALQALAENLPTTGLAIISLEIGKWSELNLGRGHLEQLVSPALLREES